MAYKQNDRVVIQSDLKTHFGEIPADTIATIISEPKGNGEDEILILRIGHNEKTGRPDLIGAAESLLRLAAEEDLKEANYKHLVSKNFWVGEQFKTSKHVSFSGIKPDTIGEIVDIKLSSNEQDDLLIFKFFGVKSNKEFKRSFVEMYFDKYDEDIEKLYGEELDLKNATRNYFLPGARMLLKDEIVILQRPDEATGGYLVEKMNHDQLFVSKKYLEPITDIEAFLQYKEEDLVQEQYRVGSVLLANEDIEKHALLNKYIKPTDVIEILHVNSVNINANEDIYQVVVNERFDKPINVSYTDLKKYFIPFNNAEVIEDDKEEELDLSIFEEKDNNQETNEVNFEEYSNDNDNENKEEHIGLPITIHELSILKYRFRIENNQFTIDGHDVFYEFNEIDELISALNELKKIGEYNK